MPIDTSDIEQEGAEEVQRAFIKAGVPANLAEEVLAIVDERLSKEFDD
jgi:hypothetical protein